MVTMTYQANSPVYFAYSVMTGVPAPEPIQTNPTPFSAARAGWEIFQSMSDEQKQDVIRRLSASPDNFRYDPRPRRERFEDRQAMPDSNNFANQARLGQPDESGAITGCNCGYCRERRAQYLERREYWSAPNIPPYPVYESTWQMSAAMPREMNAAPAPRRLSTFGSFAFNPAMRAENARIEAYNGQIESAVNDPSIEINGVTVPVQVVR